MSVEELALARDIAQNRTWEPPWSIMCVGRLERSKNFDLALRALGELRRRRPDLQWTFTLIGDGTEMRALKVLAAQCEIADRVTFTGALSFRDVQERYGRAHIAIMPGVNEGWPKVIAEAWAHGTFPVASRAGLVPWILKNEESGTVVDASPGALAEGLAAALATPGRLQAQSGKLFAYAAELSLDQFKHRLERVLVERCGLP
jgi:colanic acid/amylovoran biosynthesis glycosyltransferase